MAHNLRHAFLAVGYRFGEDWNLQWDEEDRVVAIKVPWHIDPNVSSDFKLQPPGYTDEAWEQMKVQTRKWPKSQEEIEEEEEIRRLRGNPAEFRRQLAELEEGARRKTAKKNSDAIERKRREGIRRKRGRA